jgi:ribosome-associated protein
VELSFSRSSGAGGQNVNKTSTRATVSVRPDLLEGLDEEERRRMTARLAGRLSGEGVLSVSAQDTRSQLRNRELAVRRLEDLLLRALQEPKKRTRTRPTAASRLRRLEGKRRAGVRKNLRRPPEE